jgi:hypothetical protein
MAALVGYYVAELAPEEDRRDTIDASDIERYFKTAPFPLPSKRSNTLPNATAAGYFDPAGRGKYRLNPVGHNLVVHGMPAGESSAPPRRRTVKKAAAPTKRPAAKKAASPAKKAAPAKAVGRKRTS